MSDPSDLDALEALFAGAHPPPIPRCSRCYHAEDGWDPCDEHVSIKVARAGRFKPQERLAAWVEESLPALIAELRATRAALAASEREADRLRHGVPVEGDRVCPNEMEARDLRAVFVALGPQVDGLLGIAGDLRTARGAAYAGLVGMVRTTAETMRRMLEIAREASK